MEKITQDNQSSRLAIFRQRMLEARWAQVGAHEDGQRANWPDRYDHDVGDLLDFIHEQLGLGPAPEVFHEKGKP